MSMNANQASNLSVDLIKAEQGSMFVYSDLKNAIEKAEIQSMSKNTIRKYKQLHKRVNRLINDIRELNNPDHK